ncbi:MAG: Ig-like domain-containing protein [Gemmatimonadaceae bacterium]
MRLIFRLGMLVATVILTESCNSDAIIIEPVSRIRLVPEAPNLLIGSMIKLQPFMVSGAALNDTAVRWSSSASDIVSVDQRGRISGKASGSATIRVDAGGISAETIVSVVGARSSLTAGVTTTCGLTTADELFCWGENDYGQAGTGDRQTPVVAPQKVTGNLTFTSVSVGRTHACGTTATGVHCWGDNSRGQIGDGTSTARLVPTPVSGSSSFVNVSVASTVPRTGNFECLEVYVCTARSCAVSADGAIHCWGENVRIPARLPVTTQFRAIDLGFAYVCGLDRADIPYCWGTGRYNQTPGPLINGVEPRQVPGNLRFQSISAGHGHSCGLDFDGDIYCWGSNGAGELGSSSGAEYCLPALGVRTPCRAQPRKVETDFKFIALSVGTGSSIILGSPDAHTCAVASTLQIICWGSNSSGELGNGSTQTTQIPAPVSSALRFRGVAAGSSLTCGVTVAGDAYCWGFGGRLGNGTTLSSPTPVQVAGGLKFK